MSRLVVLVYTSSRTKRIGWSINKEEGEPASDVYMDLKREEIISNFIFTGVSTGTLSISQLFCFKYCTMGDD